MKKMQMQSSALLLLFYRYRSVPLVIDYLGVLCTVVQQGILDEAKGIYIFNLLGLPTYRHPMYRKNNDTGV
jgi:urea transporter